METKLTKLDNIDKRLHKIDDIHEQMKKLITAKNINNGVLKSHGSQILTLESLSRTQTEEIMDLKTKLFQTDNNKNFIATERNADEEQEILKWFDAEPITSFNTLDEYCDINFLKINLSKTKIMVFRRR
ncbi:unnamed protein product, partial [Allacma fusca]